MNGITLKNISKTYFINGEEVEVIKKLNLDLRTNERTVLIGESGCGKSTLLRLISGLEELSSGEILKNGITTSMIFQTPRLFPWKNVKENIEFSLKNTKNNELVKKWIEIVKLKGFERAYPSQLSGGMQSRVSLARALVAKKDYILMDEPFAALDGFTRGEMQKQVLEISEEMKIGCLFVTHSIDEALIIGDRIIIMKKGEIVDDLNLKEREISKENLKRYFNKLVKGE